MAMKYYDVYIERDIQPADSSLVAIQFPAMRSQFDNDASSIELSVKPKSMKLKLDVALDSHSKSYCEESARKLAQISKPQAFTKGIADKISYTSTKNIIDDDQLFVCKTVNNRLVCRPLSMIASIRTDLSHFDLKEETDPNEEVRPVSVKFASTDRQNAPVKLQTNQQEMDELIEDYRTLKFKNSRSKEAAAQRVALFGLEAKIKPDPDAEPVDLKPHVPLIPEIKAKLEKLSSDDIYSGDAQVTSNPPRLSNTIRQRVKECLLKAKLVNFEEVYHFLKDYCQLKRGEVGGEDIPVCTKDIIDALNEYAIMVQGNWAIKSEILYGDSMDRECTDKTGISINLFTAARDHLLWLFNQNVLVSRPDFSKKVRIPDEDTLELFNQIAIFKSEVRKWELKLPTDHKFLNNFPEVVQRQTTFWKVRRANKLSIFN